MHLRALRGLMMLICISCTVKWLKAQHGLRPCGGEACEAESRGVTRTRFQSRVRGREQPQAVPNLASRVEVRGFRPRQSDAPNVGALAPVAARPVESGRSPWKRAVPTRANSDTPSIGALT